MYLGWDSEGEHLRDRQTMCLWWWRGALRDALRGVLEEPGEGKDTPTMSKWPISSVRSPAPRDGSWWPHGVSLPGTSSDQGDGQMGHSHYRLPKTATKENHIDFTGHQLVFVQSHGRLRRPHRPVCTFHRWYL